ncbi:uncharacterized protein LOC112519764 isoform X1 [Cynara cardunculus var. scolymus]|uniref:uncharacterized protein LOC112519764 isoform X1 n=1 Tax=Cynara cardunculus var. scolymus TaxID=59895 RepID=UPI000D62FD6A|nr:uncharacterized protein LOC112519764 isoform X1 [Cynara cardunculus var. scolymus]
MDETVRPHNPTPAHHSLLRITQVNICGEVAKNGCCYNVNVHNISRGSTPWSTLIWARTHMNKFQSYSHDKDGTHLGSVTKDDVPLAYTDILPNDSLCQGEISVNGFGYPRRRFVR